MLLLNEFQNIIDRISYKEWRFYVKQIQPGVLYLQLAFEDNNEEWKSRKWLLSEHMTQSELIQTAFLAIMTAEEHETREKFLFDSIAVLGPHYNLVELKNDIRTGLIEMDKK